MQLLLVLLTAAALSTSARDSLSDTLVNKMKLDFAVPDIPAFQVLGVEPDVILRPSDAKAFALMLGEQTLRNGVLPESYAAEIAPGLLFDAGRLTLSKYRAAPWFYNTRLSVGSSRKPGTSGATQVGFGLRTTPYSAGDLKTDEKFAAAVDTVLLRRNDERTTLKLDFLRENSTSEETLKTSDLATNTALRVAANQYVKEQVAARAQLRRDSVQILRQQYKNGNWNKFSVDVGGAVLLESPDSLAKNVGFQRCSGWFTAGFPASSSGQLLAGGSYSYGLADSVWRHSLSVGVRGYFGSNNAKVFAELGYKMPVSGDGQHIEGSLGGEFLLLDGTWIALSLAGEKEIGGPWTLTPSLEYRFCLPESFTKF
jgi:hypothetical protein